MSKPQPDFALDELVGLLTDLPREEEAGEGFVTVQEIHRAMKRKRVIGWSKEKIRDILYDLKEEGRLEVGIKRVRFLDNRVCEKPAYRLKSKEEEKE
jgi:hypothetical protein